MLRPIIEPQFSADASWRHGPLSVPLVTAFLAGYRWALCVATGMCAAVGTEPFTGALIWRTFVMEPCAGNLT